MACEYEPQNEVENLSASLFVKFSRIAIENIQRTKDEKSVCICMSESIVLGLVFQFEISHFNTVTVPVSRAVGSLQQITFMY